MIVNRLQPPKLRHHYIGEGYKGERILAVSAMILTIVSTVLLIELTIMQRRHTKLELAEKEKKNKTGTTV